MRTAFVGQKVTYRDVNLLNYHGVVIQLDVAVGGLALPSDYCIVAWSRPNRVDSIEYIQNLQSDLE